MSLRSRLLQQREMIPNRRDCDKRVNGKSTEEGGGGVRRGRCRWWLVMEEEKKRGIIPAEGLNRTLAELQRRYREELAQRVRAKST